MENICVWQCPFWKPRPLCWRNAATHCKRQQACVDLRDVCCSSATCAKLRRRSCRTSSWPRGISTNDLTSWHREISTEGLTSSWPKAISTQGLTSSWPWVISIKDLTSSWPWAVSTEGATSSWPRVIRIQCDHQTVGEWCRNICYCVLQSGVSMCVSVHACVCVFSVCVHACVSKCVHACACVSKWVHAWAVSCLSVLASHRFFSDGLISTVGVRMKRGWECVCLCNIAYMCLCVTLHVCVSVFVTLHACVCVCNFACVCVCVWFCITCVCLHNCACMCGRL